MTESGLELPFPRLGNIKRITQETEQGQETTGNDRRVQKYDKQKERTTEGKQNKKGNQSR